MSKVTLGKDTVNSGVTTIRGSNRSKRRNDSIDQVDVPRPSLQIVPRADCDKNNRHPWWR